ncbi:MAG: SUMF1/EgtB/PvdO family nonheme iron enzyme [Planctomycetia bacterium]|nr:SUMF1/EgtB/PvdO family nonheme iron enzyme [Planctomycetia bacterium]
MSATPDSTSSSPASDLFYCPLCGQKHRGSLASIRDGGVLKVKCAGCRAPLAVEFKAGEPVARALEPAKPAPAEPEDDDEDEEEEEEAPAGAKPAAKPSSGAAGRKPIVGRKPKDPEALARARARREQRRKDEGKAPAAAAPAPEEPAIVAEFPAGTRVGRYTLEEAIGQGGTGTVYRAFDPTTNRYVALKLLAKGQSEQMARRFLREIEVEANLRHPNLMPVFDRGEHDGRPYFTMELLYKPFTLTQIVTMARNGTLSRYATLKPYGDTETLLHEVFVPVCEGLQIANVENGVVHRDLKPDNILVDSRTLRPYVIDFGICYVLERTARTAGVALPPSTGDVGIVGTPRFLAPEQARGAVHERTDVWGLGALLRYCLTGEPPLAAAAGITRAELNERVAALTAAQAAAKKDGDERKAALCAEKLARLKDEGLRTMDDLFRDAREGTYPALPSSVPAGLAAIIRKAMAAKTAERYVNPRSLVSDVEAFLSGNQTRAGAAEGTSAASVARSVGGAVKRNLATAFFALLLGAVGFFVGRGAAPREAGGGGAVGVADFAMLRIDDLDRRLEALGADASRFQPAEAARVHDFVRGDAEDRLRSLEGLPPGTARDAAVARAALLLRRMAPARIHVESPTPVDKVVVEDLVRGGEPRDVAPDALALPPGDWRVTVGGVRIPLVLPLLVRAKTEDGEREPARVTLRLPISSAAIPTGMVLVVSGDVPADYRGPPWSPAVALPPRVAPFLMDRFEVTNGDWLAFLESYTDDAARRARVPSAEFIADPERPGHFMLPTSVGAVSARDLPVRGISPDDAMAFCAWRSKRDGATVRLPTEAEWAVAAGALLRYDFPGGVRGAADDGDFAAVVAAKSVKDQSPYGVSGLLGNAREIVTVLGAAAGATDRFLTKGGGAGDEPVEAAIRRVRPLPTGEKHARTGLRCVRDVPTAK